MLDLVVGEAHQRFERVLIVERMCAALIEHLGADEALDQAEDVRIGAALDLAEQPRVVGGQERDRVHARESVGQEVAGEVELAVLQQIAVDLPFGLLRQSDNLRVAGRSA